VARTVCIVGTDNNMQCDDDEESAKYIWMPNMMKSDESKMMIYVACPWFSTYFTSRVRRFGGRWATYNFNYNSRYRMLYLTEYVGYMHNVIVIHLLKFIKWSR